jgi:DNA polymerase III epsilon subunit-like protein
MKRNKNNQGHVDFRRRHLASEMVDSIGEDLTIQMVNYLISKCDVILAHNAAHDKKILSKLTSESKSININAKRWICTATEFIWPNISIFRRPKLYSVAKMLHVQYRDGHTALGDCRILLRSLIRVYDVEDRLSDALKRQIIREKCAIFQKSRLNVVPSEEKKNCHRPDVVISK